MIYDVKARYERKVAPKDYEHALGEVQFAASGEFETLEAANDQATALIGAAKTAVISVLGKPVGAETSAKTADPAKTDGPKRPPGRPRKEPEAPKENPKPAPAADDGFGEETKTEAPKEDPKPAPAAEPASDDFGEFEAPKEEAPAAKAMTAKELQQWIQAQVTGKRISVDKVREILKSFKITRTDDTTEEMRPKLIEAIEKAIKEKK